MAVHKPRRGARLAPIHRLHDRFEAQRFTYLRTSTWYDWAQYYLRTRWPQVQYAKPARNQPRPALLPPQVTTELRTLYGADHPNVVRYYAAFFDNGAITIAMEYCDAGSLADLLKVGKGAESCISHVIADVYMQSSVDCGMRAPGTLGVLVAWDGISRKHRTACRHVVVCSCSQMVLGDVHLPVTAKCRTLSGKSHPPGGLLAHCASRRPVRSSTSSNNRPLAGRRNKGRAQGAARRRRQRQRGHHPPHRPQQQRQQGQGRLYRGRSPRARGPPRRRARARARAQVLAAGRTTAAG